MSDPTKKTGEADGRASAGKTLEIPVMTMRSAVVFPEMIASVQVGQDSNMALIENVSEGDVIGLLLCVHPAPPTSTASASAAGCSAK